MALGVSVGSPDLAGSGASSLKAYEPASGRSIIGQAEALEGYAEVLLAESYCSGTPLDEVLSGGGIRYGGPLTADSLYGAAEVLFDSAVANAGGSDTTTGLGSVGLARVLLDRGQYAAAGNVAAKVRTAFVYNAELQPSQTTSAGQLPNPYAYGVQNAFFRLFNVADQEGVNGLDFVSAQDPRLPLDTSTYQTADGTAPWRLPIKFESNLSLVPLATGVEAALIKAEADLRVSPNAWLADLNNLRAEAPSTYLAMVNGLPPLADPGTDSARISLTFRERAFWLFGTGARLGDLRRLVRQYGRDQSVVFPSGTYTGGNIAGLPTPIPSYGTECELHTSDARWISGTLGAPITNPGYKGCTFSTKAA